MVFLNLSIYIIHGSICINPIQFDKQKRDNIFKITSNLDELRQRRGGLKKEFLLSAALSGDGGAGAMTGVGAMTDADGGVKGATVVVLVVATGGGAGMGEGEAVVGEEVLDEEEEVRRADESASQEAGDEGVAWTDGEEEEEEEEEEV